MTTSFHKKYWILAAVLLAAVFLFLFRQEFPSPEKSGASRSAAIPLRRGDTIGILAPGTHGGMTDYTKALALIQSMGYNIKLAPSVTDDNGYLAGTDAERARDINDFFRDDSVKAILCLRGGYGSARILPLLDYQEIAKHPKLFIGFSDVTALHAALEERSRLVTVHGPMISTFRGDGYSPFTLEWFEKGLAGELPVGEIPMPPEEKLRTVIPGTAEGILEGGNLTVLASLCGTPYELKGDGAILLLEDTGEDPYRVDRMLNQLYQSGLLSRVKGIVLGDFYSAAPMAGEFTVDQVLAHYCTLAGKPVIRNIPAGHGPNNLFLPLGVRVRMTAGEDSASLEYLDPYMQKPDGKKQTG